MPYAVLEKKLASISPKFQGELVAFMDFLLFKQAEEIHIHELSPSLHEGEIALPRKLGGYEKNYYMAPDFDEPLSDFSEYM